MGPFLAFFGKRDPARPPPSFTVFLDSLLGFSLKGRPFLLYYLLVISGFFGSFDPYKATFSNLHLDWHSCGYPILVAKSSLTLPIGVLNFQGMFFTCFLVKTLPVEFFFFYPCCFHYFL